MRASGSLRAVPEAGRADHLCWVHIGDDDAAFDDAVRRLVADGTLGLIALAEAYAASGPFSAERQLEFYDAATRRALAQGYAGLRVVAKGGRPPAALADVASVHPAASAPQGMPQFRLLFDDDRLVLAGSVDVSEADRLARLLAGCPPVPALLLDLSRLEFVDVAGCRVIARWAGDVCGRGVSVEIRGASRLFRRVWDLLELSAVASVAFPETSG